MSVVMERFGRTLAIPQKRAARVIDIPVSRVVADLAWGAQALALAVLSWFLLGDAMTSVYGVIADGITGASDISLGRILLSVLALAVPVGLAGLTGSLVRRDNGSYALAVAAGVAAFLLAGMAEIGLVAFVLMFFGG